MNLYVCDDYDGLTNPAQISALQSSCTDASQHGGTTGTWGSGLCSHAGSLGGCRSMSGGYTVTVWAYPGNGNSVMNQMNVCASGGFTYVAP